MLIKEILKLIPPQKEILAKGWIKTARHSKELSFLEINDGSIIHNLQIIIDPSLSNYADILKISTGTSLEIKGNLVASPGGKQKVEIQASKINIIGSSDETYPLQKKRHSFEYLREIAHLRPRSNTFSAVFRVRSKLAYAIHKFFQEKDFLSVHSPIITGSDCEGAGEMFQVTTLDMEKIPLTKDGKIDYSQDFFSRNAGLTVSGQLNAEIFAQSHTNVYTFGPTFRAENSNTARHLSEFWMIEPEMAFCDLMGDRDLAEEFVKYIVKYILEHCADDIEFFNKWIDKTLKERLNQIVNTKFKTITYTEAIKLLEKADQKFEYPCTWGSDLQTEHERYITEKVFKKPVFIIDYPKDIKAFYMRTNDDKKTVAAMDLLVPKIGELLGGSQREERLDLLEQKIEAMGFEKEDYWWYLELRKYGSTPHSGFGLGFERMVMYVTGMENIRDVIPFPRTPKNIAF
ncbi:asparagine--tRNA ligase [bacterium]|jgi:asparaginyl-tRNA synthetase|nr:asparagine--tRNA ligase [bacterium]MBT7088091.1 asparagine--tRNA ligase [bacterium]